MDLGIDAKQAETLIRPSEYNYTYEDFLGTEPYEKLYSYFGAPFVMNQELTKMASNATAVKFPGFKTKFNLYLEAMDKERKQKLAILPNQTEFDNQVMELNCGAWESTDFGICRIDKYGAREYACTHPVMPVGRLVNIDTGEVKLNIAYRRPGENKNWRFVVVPKSTVSDPKLLNKTMSSIGVSVTQKSAPILMEYLSDIEDMNYDVLPEQKSIGRLGYIPGEGFSPYVDNLVFDGDENFKYMYGYIHEAGSQTEWYETALECRTMSVTARIMLAASFASPLLSILGALPFFVHLWGGSETGKTVSLMLAASVWGDPLKGRYLQTFNSTQVGQEKMAAFLNHLPMCMDELQLTKNGKGQTGFDVYQLAEGVGRLRGTKTGGTGRVSTWDCCFLTTGEDPIVGVTSGGGAVNRVIEIECFDGQKVITDGPRIAAALKKNYGWAGQMFIEKLYSSAEMLDMVREIYGEFLKQLSENDKTDKQSIAASAILTADFLATQWIFKDDNNLTVQDLVGFMASKESMSSGNRAYKWIVDWVAENENHFWRDKYEPVGSVYGGIDETFAYINPKVLRESLNDGGFNCTATLSYLRTNKLIETKNGREYTKSKRIGGRSTGYIWLKLPAENDETEEEIF